MPSKNSEDRRTSSAQECGSSLLSQVNQVYITVWKDRQKRRILHTFYSMSKSRFLKKLEFFEHSIFMKLDKIAKTGKIFLKSLLIIFNARNNSILNC